MLYKDHRDKEQDVFSPLSVLLPLDHLLFSSTLSSCYILSSFPPYNIFLSLSVWACRSMSQDSLQALADSFVYRGAERRWKSLCVCVCGKFSVVSVCLLAPAINWHSSTSYCVCLSFICLCALLLSSAASMFIRCVCVRACMLCLNKVTFRNVDTCLHTRQVWLVLDCVCRCVYNLWSAWRCVCVCMCWVMAGSLWCGAAAACQGIQPGLEEMHHHQSGMHFLSAAVLNWYRHTWILDPEQSGGGEMQHFCPTGKEDLHRSAFEC